MRERETDVSVRECNIPYIATYTPEISVITWVHGVDQGMDLTILWYRQVSRELL